MTGFSLTQKFHTKLSIFFNENNITESYVAKFQEDGISLVLTQDTKDDPKTFSGTGYLKQDKNGDLRFTIYSVGKLDDRRVPGVERSEPPAS